MSNRKIPTRPWLIIGRPGARMGVRHFPRKENKRRRQMRLRRENVERLFSNDE